MPVLSLTPALSARRKSTQSVRSKAALSAPATTKGSPSTRREPCRRAPPTIGLVAVAQRQGTIRDTKALQS